MYLLKAWGGKGRGGTCSPLPFPIKKIMYTMDENYSSSEETRNKCMSDCPDLHGATQPSLQRKKMKLMHAIAPHVHLCCLQRPDEVVRSSGTGVKHSGEPPHGSWEINPCPLEELLPTELSLQPLNLPLFRQCLIKLHSLALKLFCRLSRP